MKILYERLIFINPLHFLGCLDLLSCEATFTTPKHATIGFSPFPHLLIPVEVVSLDGNVNVQHYSPHSESILDIFPQNPQPSFASDSLYSSLISTCAQFSYLQSLAFVRTYIPPTTLSTLSILPNLKSLALHGCYYPDSGDNGISQANELRMLSLLELSFHDKPNFDGLLSSPKLVELSIDDTSTELIVVGKRFVRSLRRLQVFRARTLSAHKMHPDVVQEVISWIIRSNPLIEDVLTEFGLGSYPYDADGQGFLKKSLKYYVGPPSALSSNIGYRNLVVLELTDNNTPYHVKSVVSSLPYLRCLSLVVDGNFICHLSTIPLHNLRRLNLAYLDFIPAVRFAFLSWFKILNPFIQDELQHHLGIIAQALTPLCGLRSLGYFSTEVSTRVATGRTFDLGPFFQTGLLEVRLHHEYLWRRSGVSCTEWEQTIASLYCETRILCHLANKNLEVEF